MSVGLNFFGGPVFGGFADAGGFGGVFAPFGGFATLVR